MFGAFMKLHTHFLLKILLDIAATISQNKYETSAFALAFYYTFSVPSLETCGDGQLPILLLTSHRWMSVMSSHPACAHIQPVQRVELEIQVGLNPGIFPVIGIAWGVQPKVDHI